LEDKLSIEVILTPIEKMGCQHNSEKDADVT